MSETRKEPILVLGAVHITYDEAVKQTARYYSTDPQKYVFWCGVATKLRRHKEAQEDE